MSWHSGDWATFGVAFFSAIAAGSAALAAISSGRSAKEALKQQRNSFKFDKERHYLELLKSDALKANASVHNTAGMDWKFYQAANATYAMESARQTILGSAAFLNEEEIQRLKDFFKEQLCYEITSETKEGYNLADAFLESHKGFIDSREVIQLWLENLRFFYSIDEHKTP